MREDKVKLEMFELHLCFTMLLFKDVAKIKIKQDKNIYIQVFVREDEEKIKLYYVDVVAPKDYKLLVGMLIIRCCGGNGGT